jgi:hypothetical protein
MKQIKTIQCLRICGMAFGIALVCGGQPVGGQETTLRGFADVTYHISDEGPNNHRYTLGQYDFFVTSRLGDGWTFLAETLVKQSGNRFVPDLARVVIEYSQSPQFKIAVGKMHIPLGYWFTNYHHGSLLEPVIDRPLAFRFTSKGGLLASHQVGVRFSGREVGALRLGYDLLIGNSEAASDPNGEGHLQGKSITARLSKRITGRFGRTTEVGVSFSGELLEAGTPLHGSSGGAGDPAVLALDLDQAVYTAFIAHFGPRLEVLTEALKIRHEDALRVTSSESFYAYAGYRFGSFVPYALYDRVSLAENDPYLWAHKYYGTGTGEFGKEVHGSIGMRWDALGTTVVKLEGRQEFGASHTCVTTGCSHRTLLLQVAIGF